MEFDRAKFTAFVAKNVEDKATREAIFDLLRFSLENASKVLGGEDNKTFHYVVSARDGSHMLFYCDSSGGVEIKLSKFPQLAPSAVSQFVRKLGTLSPGFNYVLRLEDRRTTQGFSINATLVDPTIMKQFQTAILKLQDQIYRA